MLQHPPASNSPFKNLPVPEVLPRGTVIVESALFVANSRGGLGSLTDKAVMPLHNMAGNTL